MIWEQKVPGWALGMRKGTYIGGKNPASSISFKSTVDRGARISMALGSLAGRKGINMKFRRISAGIALTIALPAWAQGTSLPFDIKEVEPNYLIYQRNPKDDNAFRAHISLGYQFNESKNDPYEFYFSYTGEFDFYAGTRPSSPVINRLNNPAFHYKWKIAQGEQFGNWLEWIDGGLEHRSNGQAGEVLTPEQQATAQTAYLNNDHVYFDSISHSTHYLSFQARSKPIASIGNIIIDAKAKAYLAKDSDVNWGPLKGTGTSISDYDRLSLTFAKKLPKASSEISFQWVLGDKLFKTDSFNLDLHKEIEVWGGKIPFYIRYHQGPMHTLADYTKPEKALGIGFKFSDLITK